MKEDHILENFIQENRQFHEEIWDIRKNSQMRIKKLEDKIRENEKIIYETCQHTWVWDRISTNEPCVSSSYICSKCHLYQHK